MPVKRIHFYASAKDQAAIEVVKRQNPHWTTSLVIREALHAYAREITRREGSNMEGLLPPEAQPLTRTAATIQKQQKKGRTLTWTGGTQR